MRSDGNAGIAFPMKQENVPSSHDEEGNMGLFLVVVGYSVFLSVETGMSGKFFICTKGVRDSFKSQEGRWDF